MAEELHCPACGARIDADYKFCDMCGFYVLPWLCSIGAVREVR